MATGTKQKYKSEWVTVPDESYMVEVPLKRHDEAEAVLRNVIVHLPSSGRGIYATRWAKYDKDQWMAEQVGACTREA